VTTHQPRIFLAQVKRIERLSDTVRQIYLAPQSSFSFSPGQHVEIEFASNLVRRYSMAGIAADPELRIHVNLAVGGAASEYIRKNLKVGDHLKVRGPLGSTFLRQQSKEPMIVLAAGVGLAAVLSLLRGMVETRNMNLAMVGISFSNEAEAYGIDELNDLVTALPNARKQVMVAFGELRSPGVRQGLVTDWIRAACGALDDWRAYAFGSVIPVESAARQLRRKGMPGNRLHVETYYPMSGR
jgi:ferredoxin-NAD(P)+ reductase (naphthalene dioxygenase ferredoxin-specific)